MVSNVLVSKLKLPNIAISDDYKKTASLYFMYMYGGTIGLATLYGIKKGTQKWWNWKQKRCYKKISIDSVESVVNIACDMGVWSFYIIMCITSNVLVAATSPISVPIILYFFEEPAKIEKPAKIEEPSGTNKKY